MDVLDLQARSCISFPNPGLAQQKIAKILNKELNRSFSLEEYWFDFLATR